MARSRFKTGRMRLSKKRLLQSLQLSWDAYPDEQSNLSKLSRDKIDAFLGRVHEGGRFEVEGDRWAVLEKYGSGYLRVRKEVADYPTMRFEYEESCGGYLATLRYQEQRVESRPRVGERVGEAPTRNQSLILDLMRMNASISAAQIAKSIGISKRKTEKNIKKLRENGWLNRVGPCEGWMLGCSGCLRKK